MTLARKLEFKPADHITDNIFLGSESSTIDEKYLHDNNIDRVLTVAAHCDHLKKFDSISYKVFDIDDSPRPEEGALLLSKFEEGFEFIT